MYRCKACDNVKRAAYYWENREAELQRKRPNRKQPKPCRICGGLTSSARQWYCDYHAAQIKAKRNNRPRNRGTSTTRGYGKAHQKLRRQWKARVDRGEVNCARCGDLIYPGSPWDLGHHDQDRSVYTGPEHRSCNRATAGRKTRRRSRSW